MSEKAALSAGDMVRIRTGAFQNFTGRIEEIDDRHAKLKVMVNIFGRKDPIELRSIDVEKISFTEEE